MIDSAYSTITYAIKNSVTNSEQFPQAVVSNDRSKVIIKTNDPYEAGYLDYFSSQFLTLYNKKTSDNLSQRVEKFEKNGIKDYVFPITPVQFHHFLMNTSEYYRGYRTGGTMLDLAFPAFQALKNDVICLFPVVDLGEGAIIPRNAGCNMLQTIETQFAYHLNKLSYNNKYEKKTDFYSHYNVDIVITGICADPERILKVAFKALGIDHFPMIQCEDGTKIHTVEEAHRDKIVDMDEKSRLIYSQLSAVSSEELNLLTRSVEVPLKDYSLHLKNEIDELMEGYLNRSSDLNKYEKARLDALIVNKKNIENILEILKKGS